MVSFSSSSVIIHLAMWPLKELMPYLDGLHTCLKWRICMHTKRPSCPLHASGPTAGEHNLTQHARPKVRHAYVLTVPQLYIPISASVELGG